MVEERGEPFLPIQPIDPASEQQIDQQLGRLAEALTRRDEILAVLR